MDGPRGRMMKDKNFYWVYMLECDNGHYYTGSTDDLLKRFSDHVQGKGRCKYTRSFRPLKMARCWRVYGARGDALKVEAFIKRQSREVKDNLVHLPRRLMKLFNSENERCLKISSSKPIDISDV